MTVRAVRSRSCAVDGWLTVSAGRRAADVAGPCREPLPVVADRVPRWDEYLAAAAAGSYDAHPGTLAEGVTASGACVETVGPGAAIGGAEPSGVVTTYGVALPGSFSCPVVLVDGGTLPESGVERTAALARLDALVAQVRAADAGADVVVAGVGDGVSPVRPRAVVASGPSYGRGLLTLRLDAAAGTGAAAGPDGDRADPGRGVRRRGHRAPAHGVGVHRLGSG